MFKIAMVAALIVPSLVWCAPPHADHGRKPVTIWCRYDNVPRRVREVIERERHGREIKQIIEMRWDGHVAYRFLIDDRGDDRAIHISESGRIMQVTEVPELPVGHGYFERPERYEELPREVRRTLDQQRAKAPIKSLMFVRRDDREFYRSIIDTRGDDTAIRINTLGRLLSIEEVEDFCVGHEARRFDHCRERVVLLTDVPREVRRSIDRERHGKDVKQVVLAEVNGRRFYRVIIDEWRGDRVLRIAEDGYVYSEQEVPDIAIGQGNWQKSRFGYEGPVRYADLPWGVQQALDNERRGREVKEIIYVRRYDHTFYRCVIDLPGDDLAVRITDDGRLVSREDVEDLAFDRREAQLVHVREEWVKYATLPPHCRKTLDQERRGRDIQKILRCESRGVVTYKVILDTRPFPVVFRMSEEGRLIGN